MSEPEFTDKFIAYVDVLGFKNFVESSEAGAGFSLSDLIDIQKDLGDPSNQENIAQYGPIICPNSNRIREDLDFQITQISDCLLVSVEVSPAGAINLVHHCRGAAIRMLKKGILVRGYITRGSIYHDGYRFIGSGYHQAYKKEGKVVVFQQDAKDKGTPFIEVGRMVLDYVNSLEDQCVKEAFSYHVMGDETGTAIFPFKAFNISIGSGLHGQQSDLARDRRSIQILREGLLALRERVMSLVENSDLRARQKG
jgi:hypothetical protein